MNNDLFQTRGKGDAMSVDDGYRFARKLRETPDDEYSNQWRVDWSNAPKPFKKYSMGRRIQLTTGKPSWLCYENDANGINQKIDRFLFFTAGCTKTSRRPDIFNENKNETVLIRGGLSTRRAIASGGGLYPNEIYVYIRFSESIPSGLYHYDPAHHQLTEINVSFLDPILSRSLQLRNFAELREVVVMITVCFWKSYFKYGDFSYRLTGVDTGITLGRAQRIGEVEFVKAIPYFDFDDVVLNDIIGIDGLEESVYAVLTMGKQLDESSLNSGIVGAGYSKSSTGNLEVGQSSINMQKSVDFDSMHSSILQHPIFFSLSPGDFTSPELLPEKKLGECIKLPFPSTVLCANLYDSVLRRVSLGEFFAGKQLDISSLAATLNEGYSALNRLWKVSSDADLPHPEIYCIVLRVSGVPSGSYYFNFYDNSIVNIQRGHLGLELQSAQRSYNINVDLCSYVIHVVDKLDFRASPRGNRQYRLQQIFAGAVLDAIMLACSSQSIVSHPILGFSASKLDRLYGLVDSPQGTIAQICVGGVRHPILEGTIIS